MIIFLYVSLGTVLGRVIIPINGGLDPRCTTELKIARLETPLLDLVPIRLAGLNPVMLFIRFSL
jgi:hypothetical protein